MGVDDHAITPIPHVNDMAECDEDDTDATLLNQHVTNATPVYELLASSFYENTWENMVDPEVAQEAFGSSWNADMNFVKWLIFANKEAVKRALTIYATKHNRNIMTSRSTKNKLSVKCVDESCMWYVGAIAKPEHGLWIVTSYRGPHSCIPLAMVLIVVYPLPSIFWRFWICPIGVFQGKLGSYTAKAFHCLKYICNLLILKTTYCMTYQQLFVTGNLVVNKYN